MTEQSANFVGSVPENYDKYLGPHIFTGFAEILADKTVTENPGNVLELAAGTGILSRKLRDKLPASVPLVITDLNEPMLDPAREKFEDGENVEFKQADAQDLPFEDGSVDVIASQFGVMFYPDKAKHYSEVHRVLKPGGSYLFNVWDAMEFNPFARIAFDTVVPFFPDNPPGFLKVPFGYRDVKEIRNALAEAGFSNVSHEVVTITSSISSAEDFATGLVCGNPMHEEILGMGGDPDAVQKAIADAIASELGDSMSIQAIFFRAEK